MQIKPKSLKELIKEVKFKIIDNKNPIIDSKKKGRFIIPVIGRRIDEKKLKELGDQYLRVKKYEIILGICDILGINMNKYSKGE